jgi:hypothetical protein
MSDSKNLKWIACQGIDLNPYNLSVPERLKTFGYALIFDEFGNGRVDKAQLCIHNVLAGVDEKTKANILVICPESLMQIWYSLLLSEIGADFKFISAAGDSVSFFSESTSNLFIAGEEKLRGSVNGTGLMKDPEVVWDLMIIDAGLAVDGVDWAGYYGNCKNKAKELLVFAPCPFPNERDISSAMPILKEMVKTFMYDESKKADVTNLKVDENIVAFSKDTPVTRYYTTGKLTSVSSKNSPNVVVCEYKIDEEIFHAGNRFIDVQSGIPYYTYGGNVFEEHNPELKNKYLRPRYDGNDVNKLRKADAKLDVFLKKIDDIMKDGENNIVVYFTSQDTLNYISKVLNVVYSELRDDKIITRTDSVLDGRFLKLRFSADNADTARITLATDMMGEHYHGMGKATHIFNYEYPENPAELERRFYRTARTGNGLYTPSEFIVFSDKAGKFDGRVLSKVMFGGLHRCFKAKIPSQNVLLWVPGAEKYLVDTISDLKSVIYNSKGATIEHARNFCTDYNVSDRGLVSTAGKAAAYAEQLLAKILQLLDVERFMPAAGEQVDKAMLADKIRESLDKLKSGYVYYEDINNCKLSIIENPNNLSKISKDYENSEVVRGVKAAKDEAEAMLKKAAKGKYPAVHDVVADLPEGLKAPVLYSIWKYCKLNKGPKKSFKEFMERYNKGAI